MTLRKRINKFVSILVLLSFITMPVQQYGFTADSVLPQGPEVVSGDAQITSDGTQMDITTSDKLIANWQSFSIGEPNTVNFWQPSSNSVALNRVLGGDASSIMGQLNATGKIFLINQNGILFGANSHVNAAGLVASTLDISNNDFLAGRYFFTGDGGSVINQGYISTPGGFVALLGSHVENNGVIEAELGSVVLAAAKSLTLHLDPKGTISVALDEALWQNLTGADDAVKNSGSIYADGGKVLLTAKALDGVFKKAVNNTGVIEARSLVNNSGEVVLLATGDNDLVANTGTIDTSAKEGGAQDGSVELSAPRVIVDGTIKTKSLFIDPINFYIVSNTQNLIFNENGDNDVTYDEWILFSSYMTESWMEGFTAGGGNIRIQALNDIAFKLGQKRTGTGSWVADASYGGDKILSLQGGNFTLEAGNNIDLGDNGVNMVNGGNINFTADANFWDPVYITDNGVGDIYIGNGTGLKSNGGNINLNAVNTFLTRTVDAGAGNVTINAKGAITGSANPADTDIKGTKANLNAVNGIGSGNALKTNVSQLEAKNTTSGNIEVNNAAALTLNGAGVNNSAATGDVSIKTAGDLTFDAGITAVKTVSLDVNGAVKENHAGYEVTADALELKTVNGIQQGLNPYMNSQLDTKVNKLAVSNTTSGNIDIFNTGSLDITTVGTTSGVTNNAAGGSIAIGAYEGVITPASISDGINTFDIEMVTASLFGPFTQSLTLSNDVTANGGNVSLNASHDVNQNANVTTSGAGTVNVGAYDNIAMAAGASTTADQGKITYKAWNGNVGLAHLSNNAQVQVSADKGAIVDNNGAANNIKAASAVLTANNGIGSTSAINTEVAKIAAYNKTSGNIKIENTGNLIINTQTAAGDSSPYAVVGIKNDAAGGAVTVKAYSDITVGENGISLGQVVTNGGDITLEATNVNAHNISTDGTFAGPTAPSTGTVTINATGNINDGQDEVSNPDTKYDISANNIVLNAGGSIGGALAPIELRSNELSLTGSDVNIFHKGELHFNGFTGGAFNFTNAGDFYLEGDLITTGAVNLSVIEDPNLFINAMIDSSGADVNLSATNHIIHNFAGNVYTHGGNFTALADSDAIGGGTYSLDPVAVVDTRDASGNGNVLLSGNDMNIAGKVKAGDADVTVKPSGTQTIGLADGIGDLSLSDSEVDNIQTTGTITIGSNIAGDIAVDNLTQASRTIKLFTAGSVNEQGNDVYADITAGKLILDVKGSVGLGNAIETDIETLEGTVVNTLNINELSDLVLKQVTAKDAIIKLSDPFLVGGTLSGSGIGTDLTADTAILDVNTAINLNTDINQLSARVRDTNSVGDLTINNIGAIALNNLAGWGYSVNNLGKGNVNITTASPITVNADVIANKNINLKAIGAADGDINVAANITSNQSGIVSLDAARDINHSSGNISTAATVNENAGRDASMSGTAEVNANDINVTAAQDIKMKDAAKINAANLATLKASRDLTMANTSSINGKNVDIDTTRDVLMSDSSDINAIQNVDIDAGGAVTVSNSTITGDNVYIDAINNIVLGVINAVNDIHLTTTNGAILDSNVDSLNLTGKKLYMNAKNNIGLSTDRIDTAVEDIWATSTNGSIYLNELDGVNLRDVRALGSVVDIISGGNTNAYYVYAEGHNAGDPAVVNLTVNSGMLVVDGNSSVIANQTGDGSASVNILAANGVDVTNNSVVKATANSTTSAKTASVSLEAQNNDVNITGNSEVSSSINKGSATTTIKGKRDININNSKVFATSASSGDSTIELTATDNDINITNSSNVKAQANNVAKVTATASHDILVDHSDVWANSDNSTAQTKLTATNNDVNIKNGANVKATAKYAASTQIKGGHDVLIDTSLVEAASSDDSASLTINADTNDITIKNTSNVKATGKKTAGITMTGNRDVNVESTSNVLSTSTGSSDNANLTVIATRDVNIKGDSTVKATAQRKTDVRITADRDINVDDSQVLAESTTSGGGDRSANITMTAVFNDVNVKNGSLVKAGAVEAANVTLRGGHDVLIDASNIEANSSGDEATTKLTATTNDVNIKNASNVNAIASNNAKVEINGQHDVLIDASNVLANSSNESATVNLTAATNDINVKAGSTVKALASKKAASVSMTADQNILVDDSDVIADSNGTDSAANATIAMEAKKNNVNIQNGSSVSAETTGDGYTVIIVPFTNKASVDIKAKKNVNIANSEVKAFVPNTRANANIKITATDNDINVNSSTINATASNGGDIGGAATIDLVAGNNINVINNSLVHAESHNAQLTGAKVNFQTTLGSITLADSTVEAVDPFQVSNVTFNSGNSIDLTNSFVNATNPSGAAGIDFTALNDIKLKAGSKLYAYSKNAPIPLTGATINLTTTNGDISLDASTIEAVDPLNVATVKLNSGKDILMANVSQVNAINPAGPATVDFKAKRNIDIQNSSVNVNAASTLGAATVTMKADNDIALTNSQINSTGALTSIVDLNAGNDILSDNSQVNSNAGSGLSSVSLTATNNIGLNNNSLIHSAGLASALATLTTTNGDITMDKSRVEAIDIGGALVTFLSGNNISLTDSSVEAKNHAGLANTLFTATNNIGLTRSSVSSNATGGAALVTFAATNGNITADDSSSINSNSDQSSTITLGAGNDINITNNSSVNSDAGSAASLVTLAAGNDITMNKGKVHSQSPNGATTLFIAGNDISMIDSTTESIDAGSALVSYTAAGDITMTTSTVNAQNAAGNATDLFVAGGDIKATNSQILATAVGGNANIDLGAGKGISLLGSYVGAQGDGTSTILFGAADGDISLDTSNVNSQAGTGASLITFGASDAIHMLDSQVTSNSKNGATVAFVAGDDITMNNSQTQAIDAGAALVTYISGGNIDLTNSLINANNVAGDATVLLGAAGDINSTGSTISATAVGGNANIDLGAGKGISLLGTGVFAQGDGTSTILLGALDGDIAVNNSSIRSDAGTGASLIGFGASKSISVANTPVTSSSKNGATVAFVAGDDINVNHSMVQAIDAGAALVSFIAGNNINVNTGSFVNAQNAAGDATTLFVAGDNISVTDNSTIAATAVGGNANIDLGAGKGISFDSSFAAANGSNKSTVLLGALDGDISLYNSSVTSDAGSGASLVGFGASKAINMTNSLVHSYSPNGATVAFVAGDDISMDNSTTEAIDAGSALVTYISGSDIFLNNHSLVKSENSNGTANTIFVAADNIGVDRSRVTATGTGAATVDFGAGKDISISRAGVEANSSDDLAMVNFIAGDNISINRAGVEANAKKLATVNLGAGDNINVSQAGVSANSAENAALVNFAALSGDVNVQDANINANAKNSATVNFGAGKDISISRAGVNANSSDAFSMVNFGAGDNIYVDRAGVNASASGLATVNFGAGDDISVSRAGIDAYSANAAALVNFGALGTISVQNAGVNANASGLATVNFGAGNSIYVNDAGVDANSWNGSALIDFGALNNIGIYNSDVNADAADSHTATINMAAHDITIDPPSGSSSVNSHVNGDGMAFVNLLANTINVADNSQVTAVVDGDGVADVDLTTTGGDINVNDSLILARVAEDGHAETSLRATLGGNVNLNNSSVTAETNSGSTTALVNILGSDINLVGSTVTAQVFGTGVALVDMLASDDITIDEDSTVQALTNDGLSAVIGAAGDDIDAQGAILAQSDNGYGAAALLAGDDIYAGNVTASGARNAIADLESLIGSLSGDTIDIGAQFGYGSGILLGSLNGDITLGDITADAVGVTALGGSIYDDGDINAHYLGLLARYDIGTKINPLMTNVDILSAYSWDTGDIYVKEANDIELGLYLPVDVNGTQWGALGLSVAANDGIINITSGGDMVVNSVISPRGGVFLEATGRNVIDPLTSAITFVPASVYAGRGWCPVVSQRELDSAFGSSFFKGFVEDALMDLGGTEWNTVAGADYFSPAMVAAAPLTGTTDLPLGPNVIAGGYSYISAPTGTIGVGAKNDPSVGLFDNPLLVNIQVLAANLAGNNSALPGGAVADAGLVIRMGGGQGSYDTGDGNGPLPVSGVIEGLVRPGTTAITGVNPSPEIDLSIVPPGYVFYNDTDQSYGKDCPECSVPLYGPAATNQGLLQIWPEPKLAGGNLEADRRKRLRAYYEILHVFRPFFADLAIPTTFFGYHPLTETDTKQFDTATSLDTGAYEFIENNLEFKKNMSPFFGGTAAPAGNTKPNM